MNQVRMQLFLPVFVLALKIILLNYILFLPDQNEKKQLTGHSWIMTDFNFFFFLLHVNQRIQGREIPATVLTESLDIYPPVKNYWNPTEAAIQLMGLANQSTKLCFVLSHMKAPDSDEYKKDQSKNDLETNDINTYTESVSMTIPSSDERKRRHCYSKQM